MCGFDATYGSESSSAAEGARLHEQRLPVGSMRASDPAPRKRSRRSDDVEVLDPRRDVAVLSFLGVQLDVERRSLTLSAFLSASS